MQVPVDLKSTVNLPKTDFPMKANLPLTEPVILERWEAQNVYGRLREQRVGAPLFTLHDGPPYANGNIHLGTALNKILKDFIVKSKSMAGFNAPYVPGWDCHGLPIELKVDQDLGAKKAGMTAADIRRACREYAGKYVDQHRKDFKRLGVLGRWDDPYLTMSAQYEAVIADAFVDFLDKGYIYKGLKPVHWCMSCRTALAEAEVEHHDHTSPSIWVKFSLPIEAATDALASELATIIGSRKVAALIWTTTPWTLPANLALSFHPETDYSVVDSASETDSALLIIAQPMVAQVAAKLGWTNHKILGVLPGKKFEHARFRHPFLDRDSLGLLGDHVTMEQGSGIVHTAPGHGVEDFIVGEKYHLPVLCPVDNRGRFELGDLEYSGKTVFEANPIVIEILRARGALLHTESLSHSYPHCWRCRKPVIFRATEQWFINLNHDDLRGRSLAEIRQVKWLPEWGMERISNMVATRPDWCISRQRVWGVPIIVFFCECCNKQFTERAALKHVVELFRRETADVWYTRTPAELLPVGTKCSHCGASEFRTERDILDVWFDSGSSHLAVLGNDPQLPWPADMYIEGGDQYRGWFHSSLLVAVGLKGKAPYKEVATHGWVLDGQGHAMHKSLGNVIEPQTIIKSHGAEILRLWVASQDFKEDLRISKEMLERMSDSYRKIRNTFRYLLSNLYDFDPAKDQVPASSMLEVDQWALQRTAQLVEQCRTHYQEYAFHKVYHAVYHFCTVEMSAFYLDITKDRLYTSAAGGPARRSAQTALYRMADALVRLIAPIMCFTAEEVWRHLPSAAGKTNDKAGERESIHFAIFPAPEEFTAGLSADQLTNLKNWDRLIAVRDEVLKKLEVARRDKFIGQSLEAKVELSASGDTAALLDQYRAMLPMLFIVSQVALNAGAAPAPDTVSEGITELGLKVHKAAGEKCERCWNYSIQVGMDKEFVTLCERCAPVVHSLIP